MPSMNLSWRDTGDPRSDELREAIDAYGLMFHDPTGNWNVVLVEGGMASGAPSILVWFPTDKGVIVLETSLDAWRAATVAMAAAAEHRWGYTMHD